MRTALLLSILGLQAFGQQPAVDGEKASIEGQVVNQITNAPVKKAQVTVGQATAITDASGHFAIEQLTAGTYQIFVQHPSFPQGTGRPQVRVVLGPGEHKTDLSLALIPSVSLSGKVLDEDGDPMSGCSVQVMKYSYQGGKRELRQWNGDSTNDRGEYHIFNLASGSYYLMAACRQAIPTARPFAPKDVVVDVPEETYANQFYPGSSDASGATKLNPPPGADVRDIDFRMRKIRAVSLHGKLSRPGGTDANQYIQVIVSAKNSSDRTSVRRAQVKPSGEFEIHGVLPGSYVLSAMNFDQESPLFGRVDIDVGDSAIKDIVIPISEGMPISGTVEVESPPSGQPGSPQLSAAAKGGTRRIWLFLSDNMMRFQRLSAELREDGAFSISGVTPGDWQLSYEPLLPGTYIKSVRLGDQEVSAHRFTIAPGTAGPLKLLIGVNPGQVDGTVQLDGPQGDARIFVTLWPNQDGPLQRPQPQALSDQQGRFTLPNVPPGRYHLYAVATSEGFDLQNADLWKALESRGEEVTIEEGGHVTKQLNVIPGDAVAEALKEIE